MQLLKPMKLWRVNFPTMPSMHVSRESANGVFLPRDINLVGRMPVRRIVVENLSQTRRVVLLAPSVSISQMRYSKSRTHAERVRNTTLNFTHTELSHGISIIERASERASHDERDDFRMREAQRGFPRNERKRKMEKAAGQFAPQ